MARDGSGNYSLPALNPVVTGTAVSSTWANNTMNDVATALTNSLAKNGETVPSANLPMGTFRHTNVGDASSRLHYGATGQIQDNDFNVVASVSGTNSVTGALSPAITSYSAGMMVVITPANNNTTATTLGLNGLTALDIFKDDGDALASGDLVAGVPAFLILDSGADDWYLQNPQSATLSNGVSMSDLARLSQANTFTGSGIVQSNGTPFYEWNETDGSLNNKRWLADAAAEQWRLRVVNDDGSGTTDVITIDRTGTTVDSIALTATAITVNGVAVTDFARLSQTAVFTSGIVSVSSSLPEYRLNETDQGTDGKAWNTVVSAGVQSRGIYADNFAGSPTVYEQVTRSGTTVTAIALAATTVTVNGVSIRDASIINASTFADARIAESNVTQHQAALAINTDQLVTDYHPDDASTTYTLGSGDAESIRRFTSASAITITLPNSVPTGWAAGDSMGIIRGGTGSLTFSTAGTINSPGGSTITVQHGKACVTLAASGVWELSGNV